MISGTILVSILAFSHQANAAGACAGTPLWSTADVSKSNPYQHFYGFPDVALLVAPLVSAEAVCPAPFQGAPSIPTELSNAPSISNYMFQSYCGGSLSSSLLHNFPLALSNSDAFVRCRLGERSYINPPSSCSVFPINDLSVQCYSTTDTNQPIVKPLCICTTCGDGALDPPEECDDGNTVEGDGCSNKCTFEAGVACPDPGVTTTAGPAVSRTAAALVSAECPSGKLSFGTSTLTSDFGGVTFTASDPRCAAIISGVPPTVPVIVSGDATGYVWFGHDGTRCVLFGSSAAGIVRPDLYVACTPIPHTANAVTDNCGVCGGDGTTCCGNGIVNTGEECDDSNTTPGDGCTNACGYESGICLSPSGPSVFDGCGLCAGDGSTCCGDGRLQSGETCDDGNFFAGDGCSPNCEIETVFTCEQNTAGPIPYSVCLPIASAPSPTAFPNNNGNGPVGGTGGGSSSSDNLYLWIPVGILGGMAILVLAIVFIWCVFRNNTRKEYRRGFSTDTEFVSAAPAFAFH